MSIIYEKESLLVVLKKLSVILSGKDVAETKLLKDKHLVDEALNSQCNGH